jgi:hypothetical protein
VGARDGKKNSRRDGGGDGCFDPLLPLSAYICTHHIYKERQIDERKKERKTADSSTHIVTHARVSRMRARDHILSMCMCVQAQIRYEEDKRQKELALRHRYSTRQESNLHKKATLTAASSPMAVAHETPGHDHNGSVTMEASVMLYHPLLQIGKDQKTLKRHLHDTFGISPRY